MNLYRRSLFLFLISVSLFLVAYLNGSPGNRFIPPSEYHPLDVIEGAGLYVTQLSENNRAYLQAINVRKIKIEQWVGEVTRPGIGQGKYYQNEGESDSPYFKMERFDTVWSQYMEKDGGSLFSLINCAFFEDYQASTQLAFPVKLNGRLITGGSSPFGPSSSPADERYRSVILKAVIWDENTVKIVDYDHTSGFPLSSPTVENAIVTYRYSDHPANILARDPPNKYHVIGTLDRDDRQEDEWMLILTVNRATLDEAANLLRQLGANGEIVTIDGGSSTLIMNPRAGVLISPQPVNLVENPNAWKLPHYLGFRQN